MKKIAILALAAIGQSAFAVTLWDQSNVVNVAGGGTGAIAGSDLSQLVLPETLFGWGAQTTANNVIADDFTVGAGGWNVTGLSFWTYQTGATAPSITSVSYAIDSTLTSTAVTASTATVSFTNVYRVANGVTSDANRRLQRVDVTGLNLNLAAGTYYLKFNFAGTLASGPWAVALPSANAIYGKNAQQSIANAAFGQAFVDGATTGGDAAFQIQGQAVPEPATMGLLALGAAFVARRRKNSK
ncbi:MAG: PEP-CTERM sorting domain-containing protein [Fimbriimonadaceae bacterium]